MKTLSPRPEPLFCLVVVAVLAASVTAYRLIPASGKPWGLDLQNIHAFHACALRDTPYEATGAQCGDWLRRAFVYPPALYWSFAWMRWFSFPVARGIWTAITVAVLLWIPFAWSRDAADRWTRGLVCGFGVLLAAQYPALFALERGNTDVAVVLGWSAAMVLFFRERRLAAGALFGFLVPFKLYPAIACVVLVAGVAGAALRGGRDERRAALRLGAGLALGGAVVSLLLLGDTTHYLKDILPKFAAHLPGVTLHSHSIPSTFRSPAFAPRLVSGAIVLAWAGAAFFRFERAPRVFLAGALATSTYVAATSFDYNLVTAYPLLVVLAQRALRLEEKAAWWDWAMLALGLAGVIANRVWFKGLAAEHVALQVAWLVLTPIVVAILPGSARGPMADEGAQAARRLRVE